MHDYREPACSHGRLSRASPIAHSLTVNAQLLGQQIGQVLAVSLEAIVAVQLLTEGHLLQHDVGLLQDSGHDVGPVLFKLHVRTQSYVLGI